MEAQTVLPKDRLWRALRRRRDSALARLTPRVRQLYADHICADTVLGRSLIRAAWDVDFERKPVSFREFVTDDFYLGRSLGRSFSPTLIADGEEFLNGGWVEAVLVGSIGWGKSTLAMAILGYDVYLTSCLSQPAVAYDMSAGSEIGFVNISVTKAQAERGIFRRLYTSIEKSPYFTEVFPFNPKNRSQLQFPKGLRCYPVAASEQAALGDNIKAACIDEANFWPIVSRSRRQAPGQDRTYDQAEAVHAKLHQRLRSRLNRQGKVLGHILVISSARYPNDFTERLERRAQEEIARNEHFTLIIRHSLWDTAPAGKFRSETFPVEIGDYSRRSRVLTGEETEVDKSRVIHVPIDLKRDFERDPDGCVRDFAGTSVLAIRPFIVRRESIRRMFDLGEAAGLKHPFTHFDVTLQQADPGAERLIPDNLHWVNRPKLDPNGYASIAADGTVHTEKALFPALYFAHVDLSKSRDATGLVIAHVVGTRKVVRFEAAEMRDLEETKPVIRVDLALRIVPPPRGEIDIPRVRGILYKLHRHHGVQFGKVTFDSFGSQESVKSMKDAGFHAEVFSVDKDMSAYESLRTALYDQRIFCYRVPVLERELAQLEYGERAVEHPASAGGSKDLADALAAVVQHCEDSWRAGEGCRGIFQFGASEQRSQAPDVLQQEIAAVYEKVAGKAEPLSGQDQDRSPFSTFFDDLFNDH